MNRLKFYALMFALVIGLLTAFGQTAQGQTIINPSFETDNVPPSPGYGAITGWTVTGSGGGSGINNATGPFTDNGAIPHGQKAAVSPHVNLAVRQLRFQTDAAIENLPS